jgi:IS5 family transposase
MKRRAATEPVIGPIKQDHRMAATISPTPQAMPINVVLAAAGYNFRRLLRWLSLWLPWIMDTLCASRPPKPA